MTSTIISGLLNVDVTHAQALPVLMLHQVLFGD